MAASQIAMRYGLHGHCITVTTAGASSLDAIGTAAWLIESGKADVLICGGTDGGFSLAGGGRDGDFVPATFYTSTLYGMTAPSSDPRRAMLPFDVKRSGIVVGEGSAILVLERGDHARARGAEERLRPLAASQPLDEAGDRRRLVARHLEVGHQLEWPRDERRTLRRRGLSGRLVDRGHEALLLPSQCTSISRRSARLFY